MDAMSRLTQLPSLYESDFNLWATQQAQLLRERRLSDVDIDHVAEEIEFLSRSEERALESSLRLILMHLIKGRIQRSHRSKSWALTIRRERREVERALHDSPSLKSKIPFLFTRAYRDAWAEALDETGSPLSMPSTGPIFSLEQTYDPDFTDGWIDAVLMASTDRTG